ncbi:PAAR domain-containing protein [Caballeronia choica]|uniref:PAAR domain-containing protein n=1 Tax=Caballeronia choica TaxID=326476 RepID=UPI000F73F221
MRKAAVRHGDPTTTGGFVLAYSSTLHDDGRKIALSGDEATCGICKGAFKIFGTGQGISEKSRVVVVDGDQRSTVSATSSKAAISGLRERTCTTTIRGLSALCLWRT